MLKEKASCADVQQHGLTVFSSLHTCVPVMARSFPSLPPLPCPCLHSQTLQWRKVGSKDKVLDGTLVETPRNFEVTNGLLGSSFKYSRFDPSGDLRYDPETTKKSLVVQHHRRQLQARTLNEVTMDAATLTSLQQSVWEAQQPFWRTSDDPVARTSHKARRMA